MSSSDKSTETDQYQFEPGFKYHRVKYEEIKQEGNTELVCMVTAKTRPICLPKHMRAVRLMDTTYAVEMKIDDMEGLNNDDNIEKIILYEWKK